MNMKDKKSTKNRLFAVIMAAALMIIPLCAFTANGSESSHDMEAEDISIATPANAETHDDEHQTEEDLKDTSYISVSTYEELAAAIEQADAETVIGISCPISCSDGADLGRPDDSVILRRTSPEGTLLFRGNQGFVQNITFDGDGIFSNYPFITTDCSSLTIENCRLINCNSYNGAAISVHDGKTSIVSCLFDNNTGDSGAHLCLYDGWADIENCTFTNGYARQRGGAIANNQGDGIALSGCVITGNTAELCGGGIYNGVNTLRITQSKIHGNTAGSEMDDIAMSPVSYAPEFDDYQNVVKLYESDGLFPNDWETREFFEDMMPDPVTVYYRTFSERNPEQKPSSITLNHSELALNIGDSDTLTATLQPEGTSGNIEWNSSDSTVASVDDTGLVTAVSAGKTSITVAAGDVSATCLVTVLPNMYTIDVASDPAHGGDVSGGGYYEDGASVTITASPKAGFRFLEWIENGSQVSTDASYTFTVNGNRKLTAVFEPVSKPTFHIELSATQGGTVSGGGDYEEGTSVTACATPDEGCQFLYWTEDNQPVCNEASYSFPAKNSRSLVAVFELIPIPTYSINVTSTAGGTAEGDGQYKQGETVTVTAIPDNGYRFISWQENDITVSDTPDFSFTADSDRTLTAVFEPVLPPEQTGNPESGSNGGKPGSDSGGSGSNDGEPGSNGDEFAANVETDVPCSVTALIVFYDENGQMISAVSQDQFDLASSDSFTLSTIAPQNWHTWKIIILAEGTSGSQPEQLNASYMVSPIQP
ncbi:MAG: hypothetical protein HFH49_17975 [Lachnospiraceae bacterium]|nr:hypothetical protein [Lachnospiraceae bacterium]